jgi:AraC family transcriptional regulator
MSCTSAQLTPVQTLAKVNVEGFAVWDFRQSANHRIRRHYHAGSIISFVTEGSASEHFAQRRYLLGPSSALIKPAGETHSHRYGNCGARVLAVEITPAKQTALGVESLFGGIHFVETPFNATLIACIRHELTHGDANSELVLEGLFLQLVGLLDRNTRLRSNPGHSIAPLVAEYLHERVGQRITIAQIAREFNVEPQRLASLFRARFGCNIGRYQRELRVQFALAQLHSTELALGDIAVAAGFYDQSHLTHAIKARTGLTPATIRADR